MKAGWESKPLGEVADILDKLRRPITKRNRVAGPYPYYGATGVLDHVDGYIFEEQLVLIGEDGAKWGAGDASAFAVEGKCWVNNHAHVLRPNRDVLIDAFLIYFLNFADLSDFISGMTVPKLNQGRLREIPIPLPPLEEQQRIVAILDEAFEGLDRAKANAEANLASARELFESFLDHAITSCNSSPERAIGEIGEVYDGPHATPKTIEDGPVFLGISSLVDGRIELSKTRHVSEEDFKKWTTRVEPKPGDVVFSYETRLGQVGLIPEGLRCCLGRRMGLVRLDRRLARPDYFVLAYRSPEFQSFLKSRTVRGATVDRISLREFPAFQIPVPPLEEQSRLVEQMNAFRSSQDHLIQLAHANVANTETLRRSLLAKAFAGELT